MPEARLRFRSERIAWRRIDDEAVVIDLRNASAFFLNPAAALLWELLESGATAEELTSALGPSDDARSDVSRWLGALARRELIETVFAPSPKVPPPSGPYQPPRMIEDKVFCGSAGCGKSIPVDFNCQRVPRDS